MSVRKLTYPQLMQMNDEEVAIYWIAGILPAHVNENDPRASITMRACEERENNIPLNFNRR